MFVGSCRTMLPASRNRLQFILWSLSGTKKAFFLLLSSGYTSHRSRQSISCGGQRKGRGVGVAGPLPFSISVWAGETCCAQQCAGRAGPRPAQSQRDPSSRNLLSFLHCVFVLSLSELGCFEGQMNKSRFWILNLPLPVVLLCSSCRDVAKLNILGGLWSFRSFYCGINYKRRSWSRADWSTPGVMLLNCSNLPKGTHEMVSRTALGACVTHEGTGTRGWPVCRTTKSWMSRM